MSSLRHVVQEEEGDPPSFFFLFFFVFVFVFFRG
jgi:hypothetical protein